MTDTTPPWLDRELWAESEAKFCDEMVGQYRNLAKGWAEKPCHADNYKMAMQCAHFAEAWQQMAWHLRKPRNCRLEQEQYS